MSATGRGRAREPDDYYTTPSWAVRRLLEAWRPPAGRWVEPSAGNGAIIRAAQIIRPELVDWLAYEIREEEREPLRDLVGRGQAMITDFLRPDLLAEPGPKVVIGNPPYSLAFDFILQAKRKYPHAEICFLLRLAFAASAERSVFMRTYPPDVYVLPDRPSFTGEGSDSADYAWFVWPMEVRAARFQVLKTTPLEERKRDRGHSVLIEDPQRELFG